MQEDIENRAVNLAISTTKLSFRTILKVGAYLNSQYKTRAAAIEDEVPTGKQTVRDLIGQNQGVSSVPIEKTGIRDFERVAKKYGIDFAVTKDRSQSPETKCQEFFSIPQYKRAPGHQCATDAGSFSNYPNKTSIPCSASYHLSHPSRLSGFSRKS